MPHIPEHGRTARRQPAANRGRQIAVIHPALKQFRRGRAQDPREAPQSGDVPVALGQPEGEERNPQ